MTKSCLLCGVGGQGTVLASRILATAAMEQGFFARTAETIGMAQRGGCVVSHVRFGDAVPSPMIPLGGADLLLGFEPGEAVRNIAYLKRGGVAVVCGRGVFPVISALRGDAYDGEAMTGYLKASVGRLALIDSRDVERVCGSVRPLNMVLVGAAAVILGLGEDNVDRALVKRVRPAFLEINRNALKLGAEMAGKIS